MTAPGGVPTRQVTRLVGVYDADGTLRGELAYWIGARLGRRHCALCDITHGSVRAKPEWAACRTHLPVPFTTYHRDDRPDPVRAAAGGRAPVVLAETGDGLVVLLGPDALDACDGSIDRLVAAIERSMSELELTWPAVATPE